MLQHLAKKIALFLLTNIFQLNSIQNVCLFSFAVRLFVVRFQYWHLAASLIFPFDDFPLS